MNHLKKEIPISTKTIEKLDKYEHNNKKANCNIVARYCTKPLAD